MDFLTEYEGRIIPIEVKAADNTMAKSFRSFVSKYQPETGIKMSLKNVGEYTEKETRIISLPLYLFFRMTEYIHVRE